MALQSPDIVKYNARRHTPQKETNDFVPIAGHTRWPPSTICIYIACGPTPMQYEQSPLIIIRKKCWRIVWIVSDLRARHFWACCCCHTLAVSVYQKLWLPASPRGLRSFQCGMLGMLGAAMESRKIYKGSRLAGGAQRARNLDKYFQHPLITRPRCNCACLSWPYCF